MSKYYILAEDTRGNWSIEANDFKHWFWYSQHLPDKTRTERNIIGASISNAGLPYSNNGIAKVKAIIIDKGMSYGVAIDTIKKANYHQNAELKRVKPQYINEHTVTYSVISRSKALRLVKNLPSRRQNNRGEAFKVKANSIEKIRWKKNFKSRKSIWKG